MKFSKSTELAIHGLWLLAHNRPKHMLASEMAAQQNVSESYLAKVLQKMVRKGLVCSSRGKRGGFVLVRQPETITVAEVAKAIEVEEALYDCLCETRNCQGGPECLLRRMFQRAEQQMYVELERTTLADLLNSNGRNPRARWLR